MCMVNLSYVFYSNIIKLEEMGLITQLFRTVYSGWQVSSPTIIVERAGSYAWTHKSWRVREEFARTVTSAISLFGSTELTLQRAILPPVCFLFIYELGFILLTR